MNATKAADTFTRTVEYPAGHGGEWAAREWRQGNFALAWYERRCPHCEKTVVAWLTAEHARLPTFVAGHDDLSASGPETVILTGRQLFDHQLAAIQGETTPEERTAELLALVDAWLTTRHAAVAA